MTFPFDWNFNSHRSNVNKTTILVCVISTPFGNPVVPDEQKIIAILLFMSTGLQLNSVHSSICKINKNKFVDEFLYQIFVYVLRFSAHIVIADEFRIW